MNALTPHLVREAGTLSTEQLAELCTSPAPLVLSDLPFEQYVAIDGASVHSLMLMEKAPAKANVPQDETRNLFMGTLIHAVTLEPHTVDDRFLVSHLKAFNPRHKKYQEELEKAEALGKELVKQADLDTARRIADAVHSHPVARELLTPHAIIENSIWWTDPETGVRRRARPDVTVPDMRVIVDVKSTDDASPREFGWSCRKFKYYWQNAQYNDAAEHGYGWQPETFVFLACEKKPPYLVAAYELSHHDVMRGADEVRVALEQYAECKESGEWPGYSDALEMLNLF